MPSVEHVLRIGEREPRRMGRRTRGAAFNRPRGQTSAGESSRWLVAAYWTARLSSPSSRSSISLAGWRNGDTRHAVLDVAYHFALTLPETDAT